MSTLEFVLPDGSPDPCPNACGNLTEDPYGGPCKRCWNKVTREFDDVINFRDRDDPLADYLDEPSGGDAE